ncbi:SLC13 family permease [Sporichthya polymorpha]|uniref:SLC13 family permease n=1 Tax=Sporichthya polymorpha TaxID=35751 RepID=UPI00035E4E4E|nr:SLC13 family permease [Sporichthya polymorpha]
MGLVMALVLLAVTLAAAIVRPPRFHEAVVAVPAAALCVLGPTSVGTAADEVEAIAPTLGFLAAVLVLGRLCAREGLFRWAGAVLSAAARGRPSSLLAWVLFVGTAVTTVLSLDATVVLFTPVVIAAAVRVGAPARPHLHATVHLANSASLLLPVSNLTNLLAYEASGLSFARFAALMALPLLVVLVVEYLATRVCFAGDLRPDAVAPVPDRPPGPAERVPVLALAVLAVALAGLVASSPLGVHPGWVVAAAALVLALKQWRGAGPTPVELVRWCEPGFLLFVAALAVVVRTATDEGLGDVVDGLVDQPDTLAGLLVIAAVGAVAANLLNNLPATLLLLPFVAPSGSGPVLALLLGVNIGPNLTYVGSLASMLWLRVARAEGEHPKLADFTRHGLVTVPVALLGATAALWLALETIGA